MPIWILIVVVAQFLNALVALIDKHIVTAEKVSKPVVYAFYVGILSTLSILVFSLNIIPFINIQGLPNIYNVGFPSPKLIIFSLLVGYAFLLALISLYSAFKKADASDVVPVVGSTNAIFTFLISFAFIGEVLTRNFLVGFIFLVLGTVVLSRFRFTAEVIKFTLLSGVLYAIYYSLMKVVFNDFAFDQAFFWSRIGVLIASLSLLLLPHYRKMIFHGTRQTKVRHGVWIIGNNILGGIAGIALLKATELGSVTIVQALNGLQFAFLVIISVLFGKITPETFGENNSFKDIVQKIIAISFIILGFYLLFI